MQLTQQATKVALALSISSGIVSVMGSTTIIVVLLRSPKRLKSIYRRLVFGMSCMDILHSLSYIFAEWPIPKETAFAAAQHPIGNIFTCDIQGFANYLGCMGSVLYDCMLSIYFVMVVVFSTREEYIHKKIEPFFHGIALLIPLASGIYLWATTHFNQAGNICWIASQPYNCESTDCQRGQHAKAYRWYFQIYPVVLSFLFVIVCMICLLYAIRKQHKSMDKYGAGEFKNKVEAKRRASMAAGHTLPVTSLLTRKAPKTELKKSKAERKQTLIQALLYITALIGTFFFAFLYQLNRKYIVIYVLQLAFVPLLGFFNFFIFIRPRVVMTMQSKPDLSYFQAFIIAITAKEVLSPGRRGSVGRSVRRSSMAYFGRRSSQTFVGEPSFASIDILAAAQIVQAADLEECKAMEKAEMTMTAKAQSMQLEKFDEEGELDEESSEKSMGNELSKICELEKNGSFDAPNRISEHEDSRNQSNDVEDDEADVKLTEDYHNML